MRAARCGLWVGNAERRVEQNRGFASDADVAQAIASITGDFEIDDSVLSDMCRRLVIQSGHRETMRQRVWVSRQSHVLREPLPANKHRTGALRMRLELM